MNKENKFRKEHDVLGEVNIPGEAYWGVHTQRAIDNFSIGSKCVSMNLIKAIVITKKAAAQANMDLQFLDKKVGTAMMQAFDEIIGGHFDDQFLLDALQGGAGTSTNMNVNEVVANRALEILGYNKGEYEYVHPIDHVNMHQSTNDVYPTAIKVALIFLFKELSEMVAELQGVFQQKEKEFADIVKVARTQMQEAVPVTMGQEFSAFAQCLSRDRWRVFKCEERLRVVNIGGTAVGTGLCAPRKYIFLVIEKLRELTGLGLARAENMMGETANADSFVEVSGILKAHACNLIKISNDLRLLSALKEINLPKKQVGSSIMPSKVNPVVLEAVVQIGLKVIANDGIVTSVAQRGSLQINEFLPLLADAMLESLNILKNANKILSAYVKDITVDKEQCAYYLDHSLMIITAFVPHIGYEKCEEYIQEFEKVEGKNLRGFLKSKLGEDMVNDVLSPQSLMSLGYKSKGVKDNG